LVLTHYDSLLTELKPDHVHVLSKGQIVKSDGPDLAVELEDTGYAEYADEQAKVEEVASRFASGGFDV